MSEKFVKISLFDLANKQISNADLFIDAMWYVPLETSERCLIGETQKIELDSHSVFIMDQFNAKAVFRFALSGVFLNQIEKRGNGPGEYGEITDFAIVEDKIAIYDHPKNKIHYYTKDGTFIYDKSVPFFYSQFVYRSPNTYLFYTFSAFNHHIPAIRDYNLLQCDSNFNVRQRGFYVNKDIVLRMNNNAMRVFDNKVYCNQFCNDTVFEITNDNIIKPRYVFHLKNPVPASLYKKGNERTYLKTAKGFTSFSEINAITKEHLIFRIKGIDNIRYMFVYSKLSGRSHYGISFSGNNQLNPAYIKSLACSNDTIIGLYQTDLIKQTVRNSSEVAPVLKQFVNNTPETNNPIRATASKFQKLRITG